MFTPGIADRAGHHRVGTRADIKDWSETSIILPDDRWSRPLWPW